MKHVLLFGLMLASFLSYSQYPASGVKQRLGWQTTGDGLVYRGAISDTSTLDPSGLNNAWMLLDTVSGNLYAYRIKAWRLVSGGGGGGITMPLDSVAFNTSYISGFPTGTMAYDADNETVSVGIDGGVIYQLGQELFYPVVINKSDSLIKNGQLVMVDTATLVQGDHVRVVQARNGASYPSNYIMGVATTDIPDDSTGLVTFFGYVREVKHDDIAQSGDTLIPGNILYPSPTQPGRYTNTPPSTPAHKSTIALVVRKPNPNNMTLLVRPWLAPKLEDASDVDTTGISQNSVLRYDTASGYWKASTTAGIVAGDTAAMLTNYINVADTATMLSSYISNADTSVFARDWQIAGTTNYLPKFTGASSVGNSPLYNPSGNKIMLGHTTGNTLTTNIEVHSATDVVGSAQSAIDVYMGGSNVADYTPYLQLYRNRSSTVGGLARVSNGDWLGRLTFQGADSLKYVRGAQIYAITDGTINVDVMPTALRFATNPGNQVEPLNRMSITSAGRVGIGTTSPAHTLDISGETGITTNRINFASTNGGVGNPGSYIAGEKVGNWGGRIDFYARDAAGSLTKNVMSVEGSGGTGGGFVGIRTTTPLRPFHINAADAIRIPAGTDAQRVTSGVSDANGDLRFNTTSNNLEWYQQSTGNWRQPVISASATGLGTAGGFAYFKAGGLDTSAVLTQSNGRIGIGVTPTEALQVNGTARATRFAVNSVGGQVMGVNNYANPFSGGFNIWLGDGGQQGGTSSQNNIGIGYSVMTSASLNGPGNIGIGRFALQNITTGAANIAIGYEALQNHTTKLSNIAIGYQVLKNNGGDLNSGIGYQCLVGNTTGQYNTAIGAFSVANNTGGEQNTGVGVSALGGNTVGLNNTGVGNYSLYTKTTGNDNVAVGFEAGYKTGAGVDVTSASGCAYIGSRSKASASGNTEEIVIGYAAVGNGSNTTTIGNNATTHTVFQYGETLLGYSKANDKGAFRLQVDGGAYIEDEIRYVNRPAAAAVTNIGVDANGIIREATSSQRFKYNISPYEKGLGDIMKLTPKWYTYNNDTKPSAGFIAEDVNDAGLSEYVVYDNENKPYSLQYGNMVALLTKAIQEQQAQIEALKKEIEQLKNK